MDQLEGNKENVLLSLIGESDLRVIIEDCVRKVMSEQKKDAPEIDEWLTSEQVCNMLHISKSTVVNWRSSGKLKSHKIGNRILFNHTEILSKIKKLRQFKSLEESVS